MPVPDTSEMPTFTASKQPSTPVLGEDPPTLQLDALNLSGLLGNSVAMEDAPSVQPDDMELPKLLGNGLYTDADNPVRKQLGQDSEEIDSENAAFQKSASMLYSQVDAIQKNLKFTMVAKEKTVEKIPPGTSGVSVACQVLLIRDVDPITATFHCRFNVFMEWLDPAAVGLPIGTVAGDKRKALRVPELALQNALFAGKEVHSDPEVVSTETGHVACKILFQAVMQMDLDMRLFPFDAQKLPVVLGLRARKDRDRVLVSQFCHVDTKIRLDEWRLLGCCAKTDRADGRAKVEFVVMIGRAYWYYVVNVLLTLVLITVLAFLGYVLPTRNLFDRIRGGIAILFAQTTFRLSIESKLPKVSYATAFDQYSMSCQLMVFAIVLGNVVTSVIEKSGSEYSKAFDMIFCGALATTWLLGNFLWLLRIVRIRGSHYQSLRVKFASEQKERRSSSSKSVEANQEATPEALDQIDTITSNLYYSGDAARRLSTQAPSPGVLHAVSVSMNVWLIHDVDEISSTFECKFDLRLEWVDEKAIGLPEGQSLNELQRNTLKVPQHTVHNAVDLSVVEGPNVEVLCTRLGRVRLTCTYYARLQLHLNLRRFPFDGQRLQVCIGMPAECDSDRTFVYQDCSIASSAYNLDEWSIEGRHLICDCSGGAAQAMFEILVRRRSHAYVVGVLAVLFGISSLVFTLFVIDPDEPNAFTHQGKIFMPVLMTLLAFKLSSAGKLPKVAHSTILDRYVIACQALFLGAAVACASTKVMHTFNCDADFVSQFRSTVAFTMASACLAWNLWLALEVRLGGEEPITREHMALMDAVESRDTPQLPSRKNSSNVLLNIRMKHIHSVNPTAATCFCEFNASLMWFDDQAKHLSVGAHLPSSIAWPTLVLQNAIHSDILLPNGGPIVLCPESGCIHLEMVFRSRVQLRFQLSPFPFDSQSLPVVLTMPKSQDNHRRLVLNKLECLDKVRVGEWSFLNSFSDCGTLEGLPCAVFGVQIQRSARYYFMHLLSLCLFSSFSFYALIIDVWNFPDRAKVLVGVLLLQVVSKLSVSGKLPRASCITVFDRCALGCLLLLFGLTVSTAVCGTIWPRVRPSSKQDLLLDIDLALGISIFIAWLFWNLYLAHCVHCDLLKFRSGTHALPEEYKPKSDSSDHNCVEVDRLRKFDDEKVLQSWTPAFRKRADDKVEPRASLRQIITQISAQTVSVGAKIWLVSDIDVGVSTFDCKFHVFLNWLDEKAVGVEDGTRFSATPVTKMGETPGGQPVAPRVVIKDAIAVFMEDPSDIQVVNGEIGHVTCRIQYHARVHNKFDLRNFPFDCQRLDVTLALEPRPGATNCGATEHLRLLKSFCDIDDQRGNLDGWTLKQTSLGHSTSEHGQAQATICMMVERDTKYYVVQVILVLCATGTLSFSFYLLDSNRFAERIIDLLKIVLSQTTFRFSVEQRLPKVAHWTPFDLYAASCLLLFCLSSISFYVAKKEYERGGICAARQFDVFALLSLLGAWIIWNVGFAVHARRTRQHERRRIIESMLPPLPCSPEFDPSVSSATEHPEDPISPRSLDTMCETLRGVRPWEVDAWSSSTTATLKAQLISIAFRIWLVRNIDPVRATFDCKFRIFVEWLDDAAKGLEKGKKVKTIQIPDLTIANAVHFKILDQSSAPEVVNSETGHLAAQILYRATLKMDQQVQSFPFDVQWLSITMSLRDSAEQNRSFLFQYCEVDGQLRLDEWNVHNQPAFVTYTKHDAPSIRDTVMCGLLVRRHARYYTVNILMMLGLISSMTFATYFIDDMHCNIFWERAEVFLGIFPLIVTFKMSAQGKLPRVAYATEFDRYAMKCQQCFFVIVIGCMAVSLPSAPIFLNTDCDSTCEDTLARDESGIHFILRSFEKTFAGVVGVFWLLWNLLFILRARYQYTLHPLNALRAATRPQLQDDEMDATVSDEEKNGGSKATDVASRLSAITKQHLTEQSPCASLECNAFQRRSSVSFAALKRRNGSQNSAE